MSRELLGTLVYIGTVCRYLSAMGREEWVEEFRSRAMTMTSDDSIKTLGVEYIQKEINQRRIQ